MAGLDGGSTVGLIMLYVKMGQDTVVDNRSVTAKNTSNIRGVEILRFVGCMLKRATIGFKTIETIKHTKHNVATM